MDVLVLIDKLDDVIHNARSVPLTDSVMIDREEIYDILDQMRSTIPEEIKQARWIVKERQEMLAEAKQEAERLVAEAQERAEKLASETEVVRLAEKNAQQISRRGARARARDPPRRRGLCRRGARQPRDEPRQVPGRRASRPRAPAGPRRRRPAAVSHRPSGWRVMRRFDLRTLRLGDASETWRSLPVEVEPFVFGGPSTSSTAVPSLCRSRSRAWASASRCTAVSRPSSHGPCTRCLEDAALELAGAR